MAGAPPRPALSMQADRWLRAKEVFFESRTSLSEERQSILRDRCGSDEALRAEVESLLAAYDRDPDFLEPTSERNFSPQVPRQVGPYQILRRIGSGGMADVYLARCQDSEMEGHVAIKVMKFGLSDPLASRRFNQERELASGLRHPNIVRLLDGGATHEGRPYFVMDFVDGASLVDWAADAPLEDRLRTFGKICAAVEYLHQRRVVHRDIKPGNIAMTGDGEPKLLDFGIAKLLATEDSSAHQTLTKFPPFTPEYASPEQVNGGTVDRPSDVFSLGLLLYELVTLQRPGAIPRQLKLGLVPRALGRIIERATALDPEERFRCAEELGAAVASWAANPPWEAPHWLNGRSSLAGAIVLLALALLFWRPSGAAHKNNAVPVTADPGSERYPSLSPDGTRVAFVRIGRGLFVKPVEGNEPEIRLSALTGCCARWSPDGRWIAFARRRASEVFDVLLLPGTGGDHRELTQIQGVWLAWSADSKFLAVPDRRSPSDPFHLDLVSIASGERHRLTSPPAGWWGDIESRFSPDGKSLAFARYSTKGNGEIYLASASGVGPRRLTSLRQWTNGIDWTPDSAEIVFQSCLPRCSLWRIRVADKNPIPVAIPESESSVHPAVGRYSGGERVVFETATRTLGLWTLRPDPRGGDAKPVPLFPSNRPQASPAFSRDGARLVFWSARSGPLNLWVSAADGSGARQITSWLGGSKLATPDWSPDGRSIVVASDAEGRSSIYAVSSDGGTPRRLTQGSAEESFPRWSNDGRSVYFRSNRSGSLEIWKTAADGSGTPRQLTRNGGAQAAESADGRKVYYTRAEDASPLWSVRAEGGSESPLAQGPSLKAGLWNLTESGLYYLAQPEAPPFNRAAVYVFHPSMNRRRFICWLPVARDSVTSFAADRAGTSFAGDEWREESDLTRIDNFR